MRCKSSGSRPRAPLPARPRGMHHHLSVSNPSTAAPSLPSSKRIAPAPATLWPQEDPRRTSPFMQYALVAAAEALQDAGWSPRTPEQQQYTGVAIGNGMSSTAEVAEAGRLLVEGKLRKLSPFFVPRILANMAAGAISIR